MIMTDNETVLLKIIFEVRFDSNMYNHIFQMNKKTGETFCPKGIAGSKKET
jgi:hypothetical protein